MRQLSSNPNPNEVGFRRNPEVVAREIGSREADPEIGPDIPAQSHGVSRRDELDRLGIHLPEIGAPHHSTGNREYQPGLVLGLAPARMGPETTHQRQHSADQPSDWHQPPRNWWSTARQRSITTAIPASSSLRATSVWRMPTCIQTSWGLTSSSCSSKAGIYSERRKIFTMSMGPAAAPAERRSGYTGSPRVTPPAGCTGMMV